MPITRILLDTCVVRNLVHNTGDQLDFEAICKNLWKYRISLSDTAGAELISQIIEDRIQFDEWRIAASKLDSILDRRFPTFLGGSQLSAALGLQTDLDFDLEENVNYHQSMWKLLRDSRDRNDLENGIIVPDYRGILKQLKPDPDHIRSEMDRVRKEWIDFVENMRRIKEDSPPKYWSRDRIRQACASRLGSAPTDDPTLAGRIASVVDIQTHFIFASFSARTPYNPSSDKRRGDVFDMALLFAIPLPAIIVTTDTPFLNLLSDSESCGSRQVIGIQEFNKRASEDTLECLIEHHRSTADQDARWRESAYFTWLARGSPVGNNMADWFATEPLA